MAERRMFAKSIIDSDAFLDMPLSTQALYFHLAMRADDDGFLNNANRIIRTIGANPNDMDMLLVKKFIIKFDDGICVIKHWRIHNYIQADRYRETNHKNKKAVLNIDENKAYTFEDTGRRLVGNKIVGNKNTECIHSCIQGGSREYTNSFQDVYMEKNEKRAESSENQTLEGSVQDVYISDTQDRLGKDRLGKDRIGKVRGGEYAYSTPISFSTQIHEIIFNQFGEVTYRTWFENSIIKIKDDLITIIVKDPFKKDIIQDKFLEPIKILTGKNVIVDVGA